MKHKVIVEIDGVRHIMISVKWYGEEPCLFCSLRKECPNIIGSPCNANTIFKFEK